MNSVLIRCYEFSLKIRDVFLPPKRILNEIEIKSGLNILDFGCGPGIYSTIVAPLVLPNGKVYALDIDPNMIARLKQRAENKSIKNIETIISADKTGLLESSIDVIFNFDMIHFIKDPTNIIKEFSRILKSNGTLVVTDHHLNLKEIEEIFTKNNIFQVTTRGKYTIQFRKM